MDDKLLVRAYNVGLGDCIYVRVPTAAGVKHLLIDCGNKYGTDEDLQAAIADLKQRLPVVPGTSLRRLDLLVATHAHEDHVRGFDAGLFAGLQIDRLWMSVAMDPDHPQAETKELHAFAAEALQRMRFSPQTALADLAESMLALSKGDGMDALLRGLPVAAGRRHYVHAESTPQELELFDDPNVKLRVLAPMRDIDGVYLGKETAAALQNFKAMRAATGGPAAEPAAVPAVELPAVPETVPANVSREDFDLLRRSLTDGSLAFVLKSGELVNNTSVVLLLEWYGRRLLFTGDAEAKTAFKGEYQDGKSNGSWNTMWHHHKDGALAQPVDFLKVGHHGSFNATPWTGKKSAAGPHPINAILDRLLPPPEIAGGQAGRYAVVSTARTNGYPTIPDPALMMELARRVTNVQGYQEPTDKKIFVPAGQMQPQRTDLESKDGKRVPWIEIEIAP